MVIIINIESAGRACGFVGEVMKHPVQNKERGGNALMRLLPVNLYGPIHNESKILRVLHPVGGVIKAVGKLAAQHGDRTDYGHGY